MPSFLELQMALIQGSHVLYMYIKRLLGCDHKIESLGIWNVASEGAKCPCRRDHVLYFGYNI